MNRVRERTLEPVGDQRVELPEERGECLSRSRFGARMSAFSPLAMAGQPCCCGALGCLTCR
jgi:hypothetical protein